MRLSSKIIGINALFMIPGGVGGTEQHLHATLSTLEKLDNKHSYVVFCNRENYDAFHFTNPLWKKVLCPIRATTRPVRIIYEQVVLPFLVLKERCSFLHSFGYFGPIISPCKHIITVHDCNWLDYPTDFGIVERLVLKILIEINLNFSHAIMSVSEFTKSRLIHHFPNIANKIVVIQSRVSEEFLKEAEKNHVNPLKNQRYILTVGGMYPHKKVPYVLDIWKELQKSDKSLHLVIIGKNGKDEKYVVQRLKTLVRTHYFPSVSLKTLVSFYTFADMCVFPSVYEGFGYPLYEAMTLDRKICVGKKDVYLESVQGHINELSFDIQRDTQLLIRIIKNNNIKHKKINNPEAPIQKLLNIYATFI
jgi:glycosyltransferase involved in cell wall biosynthesis